MTEGYTEKERRYDVSYMMRSGSSPGSFPNPSYSKTTRTLIRTDFVTRGGPVRDFRRRIAKCQDATTSLSGQRYNVLSQSGHATRRVFDKNSGLYLLHERVGDMVDPTSHVSLPSYTDLVAADNQAKMNFVQACRSAQTALQGGTVLGELGETIRMLRSPAKALRQLVSDYFNALKKGRRGSKKYRRAYLSETWLEHSFGWKPFINDIKSAGEALDRLLYYPPHIPVRGIGTSETPYNPVTYHQNIFSGGVEYDVNQIRKSKSIVIYRGAIKLDTSDKLAFAGRQFGLTVDHFIPTLWEITPYSFLVDYFTNIGDMLDCWSFGRQGLTWSNRTTIEISSCELVPFGNPIKIGVGQTDKGSSYALGRHETERRRVSRASYYGNFVPDFRWESPGASSLKWINLAALARSKESLTPY